MKKINERRKTKVFKISNSVVSDLVKIKKHYDDELISVASHENNEPHNYLVRTANDDGIFDHEIKVNICWPYEIERIETHVIMNFSDIERLKNLNENLDSILK